MAVDTKLRYNPDAGEVELVVGETVAMSSGKDVMDSWGKHWAEANEYVHKSEIPEVTPVTEPKENEVPPAKPVEDVNPSEKERPATEGDQGTPPVEEEKTD